LKLFFIFCVRRRRRSFSRFCRRKRERRKKKLKFFFSRKERETKKKSKFKWGLTAILRVENIFFFIVRKKERLRESYIFFFSSYFSLSSEKISFCISPLTPTMSKKDVLSPPAYIFLHNKKTTIKSQSQFSFSVVFQRECFGVSS